MDQGKRLKKGERLFTEGEPVTAVYLVQSGHLSLLTTRAGRTVEVAGIEGGGTVGELAVFAPVKHEFTGEAQRETKVLEVPLDTFRAQLDKCPAGVKLLLKSVTDEVRAQRKQIKQTRLETDAAPCPAGIIHRLFTELHLITRHIGKAGPKGEVTVAWDALKLYATRFFGSSPTRLRTLLDLLLKLKLVTFTTRTTEDGDLELADVTFTTVQLFEDFAEFYQYHLFKGAKAEAIFVDPLALKVVKAFTAIAAPAALDRHGAVRLDWASLVAACKVEFNIELKNLHLDLLEKKGLFVKRQSFDDGRVDLSFDRAEFENVARFWAILFEIDKWNETGHVDLNEKPAELASTDACPKCRGAINQEHKFCPHCGHKLAAGRAA